MVVIKSVAVFGCGWFGLPLAQALIKEGYKVYGSSTRLTNVLELRSSGIEAVHMELMPLLKTQTPDDLAEALQADCFVLNIPPGRRAADAETRHVEEMMTLLEIILKERKGEMPYIIFISSTSVFGDHQATVDERTIPEPDPGTGKALVAVEKMFLQNKFIKASVVRFGGLYGPGRHPVKYLSGRRGIKGGSTPVNMTHLDDAIGVTMALIKQPKPGLVVHAICDVHPSRKSYYTRAAVFLHLTQPYFDADAPTDSKKCVNSCVLGTTLEYEMKRKDPLDGVIGSIDVL